MVHLSSGGSACGLLILPQASIFLFFSVREAGSWRPFCLHTIRDKPWRWWWSLCSKRELFSWLRFLRWTITAFLFCVMKALGLWRPVYLSLLNLIVLKFHHSEGGISASSDTSEIQIVSSVHGIRQRLPIPGSLLWSLRGSSGLHSGLDSGFRVYPQFSIRLRPYRHGWLFRHPPLNRFFFL